MNVHERRSAVPLASLLAGIHADVPALSVSQLCTDSRRVEPGDVFVALRGHDHDGRSYLAQAQAAGAAIALVEDSVPEAVRAQSLDLPLLVIPALRQHLGDIASRFYGNPSHAMHIAAVTGTNGKTTVSQLFAQLVRASGYACGVIGTLGASLDQQVLEAANTTPDPVALQAQLAAWAGEAVPFTVMEASSHALDQGRLNGVDIDTAVFTNLTRDHLDYHGDMQQYGAAKALLFASPQLRAAIINAEDPFSRVIEKQLHGSVRRLRYGIDAPDLDVRLSKISVRGAGMRLRFDSPWGRAKLRCPLVGSFNALNLAAALSAALQAGLALDSLVEAVEHLQPVAGRMQPLRKSGGPLVVVDYAHTPDALEQALRALRGQVKGRLLAVFGCGGDRDRGKRPLMAEAASRAADAAIITSDNPRGEDPRQIIADIEPGMGIDYQVVVERAEAIRAAISAAGADDCVLIAGKGHEDYQLIGDKRLAFSDLAVARAVLEEVHA